VHASSTFKGSAGKTGERNGIHIPDIASSSDRREYIYSDWASFNNRKIRTNKHMGKGREA
jgi:hypothetical protein